MIEHTLQTEFASLFKEISLMLTTCIKNKNTQNTANKVLPVCLNTLLGREKKEKIMAIPKRYVLKCKHKHQHNLVC